MRGQYHITCLARKIVLKCENSEIFQKIKCTFSVDKFRLQQWNKHFHDWVDVNVPENLPDETKLLVLPTDVCSSSSVASTVPLSSKKNFAANKPIDEPVATCSNTEWIVGYKLPDLPVMVRQAIHDCNGRIGSSVRRQVCQILFHSMSDYTLYPTHLEYQHVILELLKQFPELKDKNSKNPAGTWIESIRQKFKDALRPMTTNDIVIKKKNKFGHKRISSQDVRDDLIPAKRQFVPFVKESLEDDHRIGMDIKQMVEECRKNVKNIESILDRIEQTYIFRRNEVREA